MAPPPLPPDRACLLCISQPWREGAHVGWHRLRASRQQWTQASAVPQLPSLAEAAALLGRGASSASGAGATTGKARSTQAQVPVRQLT